MKQGRYQISRRVLVPAALTYIGAAEAGDESAFAIADSNGCAAAPTWETAVAWGFQEAVERDAVALWWFGAHRRPKIDLATITEASELIRWLTQRGRHFHVLDLTTDLGVPTYAAVSADPAGRAIALGTAAHVSPQRAVFAALTEMLQCELALTLHDRRHGDRGVEHWITAVSFSSVPHLLPSSDSAVKLRDDREPPDDDLLGRCVDISTSAGLEIFVVDLTRPELAVPVVRVLVPGLRPARARFAPGRLYDVPVLLNWCSNPTDKSELNDIPLSW